MAKLYVLEDKDEFKLVDVDGNVLATEKKSAALSTDSSGHEHDESGKFTGGSGKKESHKKRLDAAIEKAKTGKVTGVIRTKDGYRESTKNGFIHYNKDGHIVRFEANISSHKKRFGKR